MKINSNNLEINGNKIWHEGNDGAGSGLDADLLDGHNSTYYTDADNIIYDNTTSGLSAVNVQAAIDEVDSIVDTINAMIDQKVDEFIIPESGDTVVWHKVGELTTNIEPKANNLTLLVSGVSDIASNKPGVDVVQISTRNGVSVDVYSLTTPGLRTQTYGYVNNTSTGKTEIWVKRGPYTYKTHFAVLNGYDTFDTFGATYGDLASSSTEPSGIVYVDIKTHWTSGNDGPGSGLDADTVDGYHAGNASGNVPVSNGILNVNLNADLLDGKHLSEIGATADASNVYERGSVPAIKGTSVAADRHTWVSPPGGLIVGINGAVYTLTSQIELDLSNPAHWDTTSPDYTVAANRKGKDFYVYACEPTSGNTPVLLLSANSTYPVGYTADTSRKIGGFHCLCADVGTITGHPLSGFVAGDILPLSVWDLKHRPKSASPEGMVWCKEANIWVDIYLQSGTGATTASAYGATITDTRTWMDHVDDLAAVGKRLLSDAEFQIIAAGGNEETNIAGSADPGTTGGHVDTNGRRMISYIGCEDCAGVRYQWLSDQSYRQVTTISWGWCNLPGNKGSLYNASGTTGYADVKLRAGGAWDAGARCGSRCRLADNQRWNTYSYDGARGAAEPV